MIARARWRIALLIAQRGVRRIGHDALNSVGQQRRHFGWCWTYRVDGTHGRKGVAGVPAYVTAIVAADFGRLTRPT